MFPNKKSSLQSKSDPCESFDESVDDFQIEMVFREPKRIKLKDEKQPRKSSRNNKPLKLNSPKCSTKSSRSNNELTAELLDVELAACTKYEKLCHFCKTIVSTIEFPSHLTNCLKKLNSRAKTKDKLVDKKDEVILPCPVCCKSLSSSSRRIAHLKKCGIEHGLSSDKVIVAVRLQEKQADERASLGLPPKTAVVTKTNEKKRKREKASSPEMELAYALSMSMVNKENEDRINEEDNLVEIGLTNIVVQKRRERTHLLSSEDMQVRIVKDKRKPKKNKAKVQSILGTRTEEEREAILSEKLAELLLSEDGCKRQPSTPVRHSSLISGYISKNCLTWEMSNSGDKILEDYYVAELDQFIEPKFVEVGGLIKHQSQIPGRLDFTQIGKVQETDEDNIEDSIAFSDDPEKSLAELYSTQYALAELLGSREFPMAQSPLNFDELNTSPHTAEPQANSSIVLNDELNTSLHTAESQANSSIVLNDEDFMKQSDFKVSELPDGISNESKMASPAEATSIQAVTSEKSQILSDHNVVGNQAGNIFIDTSCGNTDRTEVFNSNEIEKNNSRHSKKIDLTVSSNDSKVKDAITNSETRISKTKDIKIYTQMTKLVAAKQPTNEKVLGYRSVNISPKGYSIPESGNTTRISSDKPASDLQSNFIYDWSILLSSGKYSDVTIQTANGNISAHALVLNARCRLLSAEVECNKLIDWKTVGYEAAFSFLIYLYTGHCSKNSEHSHELRQLAAKYGCEDLSAFIRNNLSSSEINIANSSKLWDKQEPNIMSKRALYSYNVVPGSPDMFDDSFINEEISVGESLLKETDVDNSQLKVTTTSEINIANSRKLCDKQEPNIMSNRTQYSYNAVPGSPDMFDNSFINEEISVGESLLKETDVDNSLLEVTTNSKKNSKVANNRESLPTHSAITLISSDVNESLLYNRSANSVNTSDKIITRRKLYESSPNTSFSQFSVVVDLTSNSSDSNGSENEGVMYRKDQAFGDQMNQSSSNPSTSHHNTSLDDAYRNVSVRQSDCFPTSINEISDKKEGSVVFENVLKPSSTNIETMIENDDNVEDNYIQNVWDDFDDVGICSGLQEITPLKSCPVSLTLGEMNQKFESPQRKENNFGVSTAKFSKEHNMTAEDNIGDTTLLQAVMQTEVDMHSKAEYANRQSSQLMLSKRLVTPKNLFKGQNITPMLPYKTMVTPELKKELDKYGIRKLSRNKAIKLLVHIYDEMHPLVTDSETSYCETPVSNKEIKGTHSQFVSRDRPESLNSSQSSLTSSSSIGAADKFETSLFGAEDDDDEDISLSQKGSLQNQILAFIKSDVELYRKILMYEPIWMNELQKSLKDSGVKCSSKKLIDFLDEQCITFRFNSNANNGRQRRGKKKTKKK